MPPCFVEQRREDVNKRTKSLGLSLREIGKILEIRDRGLLPCAEVKQQLENKIKIITNQIEALEVLKAELQDILKHWQDRPSNNQVGRSICPNIQK